MRNRIGIVGGGQLGRMLAFEAKKLGFYVTILDPTPHSPAAQVADAQIVADFKNETAIRKLASQSDFMTFEIELANAAILDELAAEGVTINPSAKTLTLIKDKLKQKQFLQQHGIATTRFEPVETEQDIVRAAARFGYPMVLKARFDGYDGRGNAVIKGSQAIETAMATLAGRQLYIEEWIHFSKELSVIVARTTAGDVATYPVVETIHANNICHRVLAPAPVETVVHTRAKRLATRVMNHLMGAGVFGIELFLTPDNQVLINEIAPRVHNSGHFTQEACVTSQFAQHIRAITGLPLGSTAMVMPAAVMINILGDRQSPADVTGLDQALKLANVAVHIYGKEDTKPERKMGHITAIDTTLNRAQRKAQQARQAITI